MVKDGKALLGLSAVLAALLACQQVQLKIAPEGFTPSIAKEEISSATRQLTQEPVTPESAATWTQAVGSQLVQGANAVALPARVTLQGAFATRGLLSAGWKKGVLLAPLGLRLRSLGQAATGSQAKAMAQACDLLKVTFQCPELYTLHAGEVSYMARVVRGDLHSFILHAKARFAMLRFPR
ncbi:unnamed protein product [Effrenium voratum]|uniref:Uncharacterized protein n=1 Tax=Effrenium voratum TaxID=2562239 RepID=A0AA36J6Q9_9DINO|nr:unnamed protein product [Effrenium voratum]CAJ1450727.1 unnamed protein product [Effrenium voratum]